MSEIKFEYGFSSVNGLVKKVYSLSEIPFMHDKCDVWQILPAVYVRRFIGLKDRNGKDIYEGDILEFSDKWEWYRSSYGIKMHFAQGEELKKLKEAYDKEPMERRTVEIPSDYEWLLSSEIQSYWQVIGNIYENPELL